MTAASVSDRGPAPEIVRLFMCGDVMTGRGIDQIMPHPCPPRLHEDYADSALHYVRLAEEANGPIPRAADASYVWGAALDEWDRMRPDIRIVNLETSITRSEDHVPKGINYRMSPENAGCLAAAAIGCCALGNNHVLDWGRAGLLDTLTNLERLHIQTAGAGRNLVQARAPAILDAADKGRVLVFSFASPTSGTPRDWAATAGAPGVNLLPDLSEASVARVCEQIANTRRPRDTIVVSIHWGPNWGYGIPQMQRRFAHALIDRAGVSVVHGHSSHHPKAIEVYRNRLVLYGCGDFLNDYEGIEGYEKYRDDLTLMYFADIATESGELAALELVPLRIRNFRLVRPSPEDAAWLHEVMDRECQKFSARIERKPGGHFALAWPCNGTPGRKPVT